MTLTPVADPMVDIEFARITARLEPFSEPDPEQGGEPAPVSTTPAPQETEPKQGERPAERPEPADR
ncbi:hypothetical protein ACFPZ0_21360 [Streptomonospora nanhaiensis]|uniref:Uncharacterized protein n=1 Tax=Streptomonospora nanhaiensis TaxID=1323731 RepID=A0A853BP34_9ACTN|nr:hypothetical protein [Streptomonospora nanhaiensis]MBV2364323.1 hypothetical protein [Streptomonospora nanhaiensis]MBX9390579.1 hypothetical protein [Streptomonospora nanhaiensis]NYI97208.1 hypothetical protein [Streptomonospora nanhaiensis]